MNAETKIEAEIGAPAPPYTGLIEGAFPGLAGHLDQAAALDGVLAELAELGDAGAAQKARQLRQRLATLEPSVTMIGQVKAGKTSLVNALIGWPGLLPADVNPWTSVVTSLHLDPVARPRETQASFRFFEQSEWERLVAGGGRMGEIAGRAGAEAEVETLRAQVAQMQEKSRQRLGRKFELLLGQTHDFARVDRDLIERYVCLGDDLGDETDATRANGRFADITKSADVYLHRPGLPMPLCIRDTPGVNDTFMVREQITLNAIRESRICVVVLSAHQALSSVDMGLIRMIQNIAAREVVIFVNRIDELSDPGAQVPEIAASITATLAEHQGPQGIELRFGSAYWAELALRPDATVLHADSGAALQNWARANRGLVPPGADQAQILWHLSGMPGLLSALSDRIAEGPGQEALAAVGRATRNLVSELRAANNIVAMRRAPVRRAPVDRDTLCAELEAIRLNGMSLIREAMAADLAEFHRRADAAHNSFLQRATAALIDHLEKFGEEDVWKYDPTGLRVLLRSAYQLFAKRALGSAGKIVEAAAADISALYTSAGLVREPGFVIEPPAPPRVPPPVMLGQTIALDLQANWWAKWWRRRRGYQAYTEEFFALIEAESAPILAALKRDHAQALHDATLDGFAGFLDEQLGVLASLAERDQLSDAEVAAALGGHSPEMRRAVLDGAMKSLQEIAA